MSELPSTELGLDNFWSHMSEVTDSFTDVTRFGVLHKLANAYQQVMLILSAHFQCWKKFKQTQGQNWKSQCICFKGYQTKLWLSKFQVWTEWCSTSISWNFCNKANCKTRVRQVNRYVHECITIEQRVTYMYDPCIILIFGLNIKSIFLPWFCVWARSSFFDQIWVYHHETLVNRFDDVCVTQIELSLLL